MRTDKGLYTRLRFRGYSHTLLKKAYNKASKRDRKDFIFSTKSKDAEEPVRIITQCSRHFVQLQNIITKFWPLLLADTSAKKYIKSPPEITHRWPPSLRDQLVRSHLAHEIVDCPFHVGTFSC